MKHLFADTFYYLALLSPNDEAYKLATAFTLSFTGQIITTDWIITELADGLSAITIRATLIRFINTLQSDPAVRIVPASRRLLESGWKLYQQRQDKNWSLTDCISFVVMRNYGITEALTGDRHFEQAGFNILLK
jgi:uncharacterized protein